MRTKTRFILVIIIFIMAAGTVFAETPHEQLKQMVEQLQKSPNDNALREKIIRLAQELKPAPAVPEEAERRMARGTAAFESAKDVSGYENAAREFQAATNDAPWYQDAYFNLGVAQEMSGKFNEAMESFRMCLLAAPDGKDVAEVKKRIYKLEYAAEEAAKVAAVEAEKKRKQQETESVLNRLLRPLEGAKFSHTEFDKNWNATFKSIIEITNGDILIGTIMVEGNAPEFTRGRFMLGARTKLTSRQFSFPKQGTCVDWQKKEFYSCPSHGEISEDGRTIIYDVRTPPNGDERRYIYYRE